MKLIFLDIDGVLNGYNTRLHLQFHLLKRFTKHPRKYLDLFQVHIMKILLLFIIVRLSKAKIVLSSSWRFGFWTTPIKEMNIRCKKLYYLFKLFHIDVIGITPANPKDRGAQIDRYMKKKNNIESFVIIDDEIFDIKNYYPQNRIICTEANPKRLIKYNCCGCYDGAGIKFKHIIPTLKILNTPIESK